MIGDIEQGKDLEKAKQLAVGISNWDKRIVEIAAVRNAEGSDEENLDLICTFDPEPQGDATGFFWIANLLTRMEFEALDERLGICQPVDLGFKIGDKVFLPNGKILGTIGDHVILWPNHEE